MADCAPEAVVQIGDARLILAKQVAQSLDVLVVDAFSSDALPAHLYTKEAFDIYDRILAQNGTLLIHISNRYLNLGPVLAKEAEARGWRAAWRKNVLSDAQIVMGEKPSLWVVMSRSREHLEALIDPKDRESPQWFPLNPTPNFNRWSDDFNSIFSLLKWGKTEE